MANEPKHVKDPVKAAPVYTYSSPEFCPAQGAHDVVRSATRTGAEYRCSRCHSLLVEAHSG